MRKDIKASCQKRLSRIEGQVRGLSKMVEDDRYCIDIVTQISAVRAALRRVEEEVLRDHVSHCVEHAITSGNKADQREKIAELMAVEILHQALRQIARGVIVDIDQRGNALPGGGGILRALLQACAGEIADDLGAVLIAARFRGRVDLGEQIVFDGDGDPLHPKFPS